MAIKELFDQAKEDFIATNNCCRILRNLAAN